MGGSPPKYLPPSQEITTLVRTMLGLSSDTSILKLLAEVDSQQRGYFRRDQFLTLMAKYLPPHQTHDDDHIGEGHAVVLQAVPGAGEERADEGVYLRGLRRRGN